MKKVLITGAGSYIGTAFEKWIADHSTDIVTETLDMKGEAWREHDFHGYDSVFHVAGLAHADVGKVTEETKQLYYKVNCDLAAACAKKAKEAGAGQFIFMSSIIVYGDSAGIGKRKVITPDTPLAPANFYGDSKVRAEEGLRKLDSDSFRVVILRPPMIYGKGSKGNYPLLAKLAGRLPFFPKEENQRSMLYIGNLCRFVELMVENRERGIFFPQNREYVRTSELVAAIAAEHGKRMRLTGLFHPALLLLGKMGGKLGALSDKAFGNLVYEKEMSEYREEYRVYGFRESVHLTESRHV
ncbi:MAG: NAD-dependent epimerase/dehydratase family protein [Lachnospiraceae bacterium]|nr:NAD-dependent epimerase/dehydratase family protein [uncultured Acetatifactor sp.]MCI9218175.1 NAD-dependent epimerase/dehydratase family protein [Lachnospiraceae bacterium]